MPKKRLSVVLIGAGGNMRNAHVARIAADGAVAIAGVADPVELQARLLMERAGHEIPYFRNWLGVGGWRLDPDLAGGGMFMDTGSHLVAAMLWVTDLRPDVVGASFDHAGRAVDVNGGMVVRFANDAVGTLTSTGNASRHDERLAISGSEGSLVLHLHQWRVRSMLLNDEPVEIPKRIKPSTPDAALFRWIRNGLADYESQAFALQVARLTEAAYRSADENRPVKVRR